MTVTLVRAACPHDRPDTCAMQVTVENGRAVKVQGHPDHPPTHGALCTKVSRYTERTYHAERVLHPLKRVGPKGSGRFERVRWDDALGDIAARLSAIAGPNGASAEAIVIFRELAVHMGSLDPCFVESDEALARTAFRPAREGGIDFAALREHGWVKLDIAEAPFADGNFQTPGGKCRIDAPGYGVPDYVPNYESPTSSPALAARYPLAMISPPERNFRNSSFVNVKSLRGIEGEPVVEIADADARARGIATGQVVRIFNDRGNISCKAIVGARARPGVVNGLGIWWKKLSSDGRNVNELTHQGLTDIGRAPSFYDCLVEVEPAERATR
jgi:anaerobic selenocysteine-containing dehydrogenase